MASYYIHLSLQFGHTPLIEASYWGHVGCVQLLLDRGAQDNLQDHVRDLCEECCVCWLVGEV